MGSQDTGVKSWDLSRVLKSHHMTTQHAQEWEQSIIWGKASCGALPSTPTHIHPLALAPSPHGLLLMRTDLQGCCRQRAAQLSTSPLPQFSKGLPVSRAIRQGLIHRMYKKSDDGPMLCGIPRIQRSTGLTPEEHPARAVPS